MRKENFFGIVLLLLLSALCAPLPAAEAFKFAAEEAEADAAEAAAADAPVAFGEKKGSEAADVGLHPTTYDKDESSSREDRQLGKKERFT